MKTFLLRGFFTFLMLLVFSALMIQIFQTPFGTVNFFDRHGYFFLFFIALFPRLTLLFSSVAFGGFLWWIGFFICPRILIASLATMAYFQTNPILVTIGWMFAIGGETFEKWGLGRQRFYFRTFRAQPFQEKQQERTIVGDSNTIEADFKIKD